MGKVGLGLGGEGCGLSRRHPGQAGTPATHIGSSMAGVTHRHGDCSTAVHAQANCHSSIVVTSVQTHTKRVYCCTNSHLHVKVTLPCNCTCMHIPTQSCTYMHAPLHDTHAALYTFVSIVSLCTHAVPALAGTCTACRAKRHCGECICRRTWMLLGSSLKQ